MQYAVGIDIGGTNTKLGLVDRSGNVLCSHEFKTTNFADFPTYVEGLEQAIKSLMEETSGDCAGIGIGAPNGNFYTGEIQNAPNLPFGKVAPIVATLKKDLDMRHIVLTNDANAAALGEKFYGGGRNIDHFIVITIGTGLGAGIIIDGNLLYGADGNAGELGHVCAVDNGRLCGCGKRGCLETYVSATGIRRTYFELLAKYNGNSMIANQPWKEIDAKVIEQAARSGDKVSIETYRITGEILGKNLANFVAFSRPSAIFLFGGPVKSGELLLKPTHEAMEKYLMPIFRGKIKLEPSQLPESDAAILGASALVW